MELLRDDSAAFIRALESRLGLASFAVPPGRVNTSLSPTELAWYPRLTRIVRRLPIGARLKRLYLRGVFANHLRRPIAVLQRIRPSRAVVADTISDELLNAWRGKAESLRANPLYALYAADYLLR